jgi:hypothetical protein
MDTTGNSPAATVDDTASRRMERERRRYCRLTARCLPQWAPLTLVQRFDDGLSLLGMARRERRRAGLAKHSAYEQWCADRIAFTVRLCTYHPDMRGVWATLATTPATGKGRRHWTGEGRIAQVLRSIDIATLRFAKAPKTPPAVRRKSLSRAALAAQRLVAALQASPEAAELFRIALGSHERRSNDAATPAGLAGAASGSGEAPELPYMDGTIPPWRAQYLLYNCGFPPDDAQQSRVAEILADSIDLMREAASVPALFTQPGRPDESFQAFMVRSVSIAMRRFYGRPLRDVVALLVSAIIDRPEALSDDGIRPYLRPLKKASRP